MPRLVVFACLLAACSPAPQPAGGASERLIALAPSLVRVVQALGAGDHLVAVDEFSRRLPGNEHLPSVGGLFSPDLERTLELSPSLVIAVRSAELHAYVEHLRARGVRVEEFEVYTLEEVLASFERVGALVGREREARELVSRVRGELAAVAASVEGLPRPTTALVLERDPLYVAGGGGFTHALLEVAGARNVFADLAAPYPRVSLESLADRAPELLLDSTVAGDTGAATAAEVRAYWGAHAWVRRVSPLARDVVTLPGPDLGKGARLLADVVHPERDAAPGSRDALGSR
jgi:ABC-type Fe3+-hydroxamate transport system substrate-binding protein